MSGNVELAGDSAIEFTSGQITSLAASSRLTLSGNSAFIEDSTALGSNSALTGLSNVSGTLDISGKGASVSVTGALTNNGSGTLDISRGASVATTGALTNNGSLQLGDNIGVLTGLSTLSVAGTLTNTGGIVITDGDGSDTLTADTLSNSGSIFLGDAQQRQALLDVTTGVAGFGTAGTLTGFVKVYFGSAIEFLSGQISTIATGATLEFFGTDAFIEDSTALARVEQRSEGARQRLGVPLSRGGLGVDDRAAHHQRHSRPRQPLFRRQRRDPVDRRRADQHRHAGRRRRRPRLVPLRYGEFLRQ